MSAASFRLKLSFSTRHERCQLWVDAVEKGLEEPSEQ
jgi:hypothetical protein